MKHRTLFAPFIAVIVIITLALPALGEDTDRSREIIMTAMRDEMNRSLGRLEIEGMERPFFISYNIFDSSATEILATLGSVVRSSETRSRNHTVRVMVGDYTLNDENFQGRGSRSSSMIHGSSSLPIEDDYQGIRRALWIATDDIYKHAAELFEHKKAALKQQTMTDETRIDDFSRAPVVLHTDESRDFDSDRDSLERYAESISDVFSSHPDIFSSQIRVYTYHGDACFVNSEGTEAIQPLSLATIQVNAYTQATDGEPLSNHLSWHRLTPNDLPDEDKVRQAVEIMAGELEILRDAPVFDDSYFGPVMFEDQAVTEFFCQRLFSGKKGLIAHRAPVSENRGFGYRQEDETLEDRIGRRILARDISITETPGLATHNGMNLIGSYAIDMEGVIPPSELVLVDNGILTTLLSNRTPTPRINASNGHQRPVIGGGSWTSTALAPGVVTITTSNGKSRDDLKRELMRLAGEEGFEYGILVRRLKPTVTGARYDDPMARMTSSFRSGDGTDLTKPVLIYKVYVADGREEPVRSVSLGGVGISALRHIVGATESRTVTNALVTANWSSGVPATFIVPQAILLEELEVKKEKRDYTPRLPVVKSPLGE